MTPALDHPAVQLGAPVRAHGIAVTPVFPRRDPLADYIGLVEALAQGLTVDEVDEGGNVPELRVVNTGGRAVLLHDGEELVGAKQNRILDETVLVPAHGTLTIPVSCVEQGRWSRRSWSFAAAPHTSPPELRRRKADRLGSVATRRGGAQHEVWQAVAEKAERMQVQSPTGALADAFATARPALDALAAAFPAQPGQSGAVVAFGGHAVCVDLVSRPEVYAGLHARLLAGYLLDAVEVPAGPDCPDEEIAALLAHALQAPRARRAGAGLGLAVQASVPGVIASGLVLDRELIQLSAYAVPGPR